MSDDNIMDTIFDGDIDLDEIPDDPNYLPENTYRCQITKAVLAETKKKDKIGLTITYQIIEGEYSSAFPFTEWLQVPQIEKDHNGKAVPLTVDQKKQYSRIMKHFNAYGFGADEIKSVKPDHLIGRVAMVQTDNKKQDDGTTRIRVINVSSTEDWDDEHGIVRGSGDGTNIFDDNDNEPDF